MRTLFAFLLLASPAWADQLLTTVQTSGRPTEKTFPEPLAIEVRFQWDWFVLPDYVETQEYLWSIPIELADVGQTFVGTRQTVPVWHAFNRALTQEHCCDQNFSFGLNAFPFRTGGPQYLLWSDQVGPPMIDSNIVGTSMHGYHLTRIEVDLNSLSIGSTSSFQATLRIYGDEGQVPEPAAGLLTTCALCGLLCHRRRSQ